MGAAGPGQGYPVGFRLSGHPPGAEAKRGRILYGRRLGRPLRPAQRRRLSEQLPQLQLALPETGAQLELAGLFGAPKRAFWLEVGFGAGEHLAAQAAARPDIGFIGCEPFINGVAQLVALIEEKRLDNVRIHPDDARQVLDALPDASIDRLFVLFPDPWPKARHHRRRFIGPENLPALARVMADGAELRTATDDVGYLRWMLRQLAARPEFEWLARRPTDWRERPPDWPETRYEAKALAAGRRPAFLRFRRRSGRLVTPAEMT